MGQCMGCQQKHGSMHGLSTDMGQCMDYMGYQQRHGSVLPLAGAATSLSFCHSKSFCFVVTSIFVSRQKMCLSQPTCVCHNQHMFVATKMIVVAAPASDTMHGLSTDMGQCLGCQQTWVSAWADNRHGSMHGLTKDMGQCMG